MSRPRKRRYSSDTPFYARPCVLARLILAAMAMLLVGSLLAVG